MRATLTLADGTKVKTATTHRFVVIDTRPPANVVYRTDDAGRALARRNKAGGAYAFAADGNHTFVRKCEAFDTHTGEVL